MDQNWRRRKIMKKQAVLVPEQTSDPCQKITEKETGQVLIIFARSIHSIRSYSIFSEGQTDRNKHTGACPHLYTC
jgi:hypothetical protein